MLANLKKFFPGLVIIILFYILAFALRNVKEFFLFNFMTIGTLVGLGFGLWPILSPQNRDTLRKVTQLLLGGYIFFAFGIGLIYPFFNSLRTENMQIEGFWFYLILGGIAGTVYHYLIAKIAGPFIFGRTFCGWVCWTAAVLDFFPWNKKNQRITKKWDYFRLVHFSLSLALILVLLYSFNYVGIEPSRVRTDGFPAVSTIATKYIALKEFWWFLIGNSLYFLLAIVLAYLLKDNRAFCKYVCPITVLMRLGTRFSLLKIKTDKDNCEQCGKCEEHCLMDIQIREFAKEGKRISSSECIICLDCARVCPNNNLRASFGFDVGFKDQLDR